MHWQKQMMMTGIRGKHSVFLPAVTWIITFLDGNVTSRERENAKIISPQPLEYIDNKI